MLAKLFAGYNLSRMLKQDGQHLEGLFLQGYSGAVLAQLSTAGRLQNPQIARSGKHAIVEGLLAYNTATRICAV